MEELFNDIEGCDVTVDDLIVWGRNDKEYDQRLINVLDRSKRSSVEIEQVQNSVSNPDLERLEAR
jgi:methyl coenzyme M reductase subunit D